MLQTLIWRTLTVDQTLHRRGAHDKEWHLFSGIQLPFVWYTHMIEQTLNQFRITCASSKVCLFATYPYFTIDIGFWCSYPCTEKSTHCVSHVPLGKRPENVLVTSGNPLTLFISRNGCHSYLHNSDPRKGSSSFSLVPPRKAHWNSASENFSNLKNCATQRNRTSRHRAIQNASRRFYHCPPPPWDSITLGSPEEGCILKWRSTTISDPEIP